MDNRFLRTEMLIGQEKINKLKSSSVIVFGIGGVGGYVCEALARAGIEKISLVDNDKVDITNINRQIVALQSTVGRLKTHVMRERILDINPECEIVVYDLFFGDDTVDKFDFSTYDYVVDAIDTVSSKLLLIELCKKANVKIISSMGTGNKTDPSRFEITDIYKTSGCPLARVMRRELRKRGIKNLTVLYSNEEPKKAMFLLEEAKDNRKIPPATISFVPPVAGMMIAGKVICDLAEVE